MRTEHTGNSENSVRSFNDAVHGTVEAQIDDVVLARTDGVPAYNLAVVVDDALQGIRQVVRGDDLLTSTPRQMLIGELLGLPTMSYAHIPLVLNAERKRLSKRDGAVTLNDQLALGREPGEVLARLGASLGLCDASEPTTPRELIGAFEIAKLPTEPWVFTDV